jgi:hypothetical protein
MPIGSLTWPVGSIRRKAQDQPMWLFGTVLSHGLGLTIFFQIVLSRIVFTSFLPTMSDSAMVPIRALAIMVLLRGFGKRRQTRACGWDIAYLGFACAFLVGAVVAEFYLVKRMTLLTNVGVVLNLLDAYLFFLVLREALNRQGFSLKVVMGWWIAALFIQIIVAWLQVLNPFGFTGILDTLVKQSEANASMYGPPQPFQARGLHPHANPLAAHLALSVAVCCGILYQRSNRPGIWLLLVLSVVTTFATYSRTGLAVLFAMGLGVIVFLFVRGATKPAIRVTLVGAAVAAIAIGSIFAFDIRRYKEVFEDRQVKSSAVDASIELRSKMSELAFRNTYQLSPVFGIDATDPNLQTIRGTTTSAYNPGLIIFNQYATAYARFGAVGILWTMGLIAFLVSMIRRGMANHPFAIAPFAASFGLAIHGMTENLVTDSKYMMPINLLVALAVAITMSPHLHDPSRVAPSAKDRVR